MIRRRRFLACIGAALLPACAATAQPTSLAGQYLLTLAAGADEKSIHDVYGRFGIRAITRVANNVFLVVLAQDPGLAAMEKLRSRDVEAVQPNYAYRGSK